jgi:hypothetical protein
MSKSTKNRKKRSTNMSCGLLKELHALIAFACYDLPSLIKRGASLSEGAIEDVMTSIFYGEDTKNGADPDLITYVDQFMLGLNKFKGLYTQSLQAEDQMVHLEKLYYCRFRNIYTVTRNFLYMLATVRLRRRYCC